MLIGLPKPKEGPKVSLDTFKMFIPNLQSYVEANKTSFDKFNDMLRKKLNYTYWGDDWELALSLGIAHYLCLTNPALPQSFDKDAAVGGVMSSRSVSGMNYSYDTNKTMSDHPSAHFWNQTGYGRALFTLSESRGYIGMFIGV